MAGSQFNGHCRQSRRPAAEMLPPANGFRLEYQAGSAPDFLATQVAT